MQYHHTRPSEFLDLAQHHYDAASLDVLQRAVSDLRPDDDSEDQLAIDTASSLIEMGFGPKITAASLLYRTPFEKVKKSFDPQIAELAERIQKINAILSKNEGRIPYDRLQKIVLAVANDPRILVWRTSYRLQQLRFLQEQPKDQQRLLAQRCLDNWVPVIAKLGLHAARWEMEDLAMKKLYYKEYKAIQKHQNDKRDLRQQKMESLVEKLKSALFDAHIQGHVSGRVKNFWRIYQKILQTKRKLSEIHDLIGARVIVQSANECYEALAVIQNAFKLDVEGYDDYIAKPKKTGYQSIHANLDWKGIPAEIQIRTWDMHANAEEGRAAHWEYKNYQKDPDFDPQLSAAKQLTSWFHEHPDVMENLDLKLEQNKIFVFTPKNDVVDLPKNATPIDFAYAVHSALGNKIEKAIVNRKLVPLEHPLQNGDTIEILVSEKQTPKQGWLAFVQTDKARQKIRSMLHLAHTTRPPPKAAEKPKTMVQLKKNATLTMARCCNPLPGDELIGHKTTKRKIKLHRTDCPNAKRIPENDRIYLESPSFTQKEFDTVLRVESDSRPGVLSDILSAIAKTDAKIISTEATTHSHAITSKFRIKTKNKKTIEHVLSNLNKIEGVKSANRT
ncbi:MAG: TGS domain-containing protein [Candidatus Diapherotrites archaeon]|nr:TGS domain-containing protein [Candidatus Diapherotrites archaeon]